MAAEVPDTEVPDAKGLRPVGRFQVTADTADIAAFRAAAALPLAGEVREEEAVPATYPFRWIGIPEIRAALRRIEGVDGGYPIHMGQTISYLAPVTPGASYGLDVRWRAHRARADRRMTLEIFATALDGAGAAIVNMQSLILIVPPSEAIR